MAIVYAFMHAALSRPCVGFALQRRIRITHEALSQVVEAVGRVVGDFLGEFDVVVALLEMLGEVGEAVQLVKDGHHEAGPVVVAVDGDGVGVGKVEVCGRGRGEDVAACFCSDW